MLLHVKGWEDGEPIERTLDAPDRWVMHSADEISVELDDGTRVAVKQKPRDIPASRMGVGACLWEGELLLAAYLAAQPRHRFIGQRVIELGAGPGMAGLMVAMFGAEAVITDKDVVLPLIRENIALNGLPDAPGGEKHCGGCARAEELEWGKEGYLARAALLAAAPVDLVIAADVTYVDQDGQSPSTEHFVEACKALCGPQTTCLVAFELRSSKVKETFVREAGRAFSRVERLSKADLPRGFRGDHIELYSLRL
ncbi:N-lysine methyltransferase-like protein [Raphidocelis subcapitata]|uniref:N-lysine methyltransferase-like protein n=1 Tax=Raphidocelis subcapitata TaxID=307507 RepID=A0A2V0NKN4_9CHLO|nr:N-lysine methyltransferase-like protein [Raphidocelis subcapitata]|eukprot:GBF87904.1 N-lysine methyltransferase-like protein [Raphidocelis subcapitata]